MPSTVGSLSFGGMVIPREESRIMVRRDGVFFYGPMTIMIRILYLPDLPRPVWKKPQIVDPHGGNDHQLVAGIGRVPKLGMVESPGKEVGLCLKKTFKKKYKI